MHSIMIIDFAWHGTTLFIEFTAFDAERQESFQGMVRVVDDTPYGDIIHEKRSPLSVACRTYVATTLREKIARQEFD